MKAFLKILAAVVLLGAATVGGLYLKWRPDEEALRAQGWLDDTAKATAAATASRKPLLIKLGKAG